MRIATWRPISLLLIAVLVISALVAAPSATSAGEIAPQVVETSPLRGEELAVDGSVTFYFDLPMDRASVEAALVTEPNLSGRFTWIDDSIATFQPGGPLERATEYKFTIGGGARSSEGTPLKDTFTLNLRTVGFLEVAQVIPADGTVDVEAAPTITVLFNRPVVPLLPVEEMKDLPNPLAFDPPAEGVGEWLSTSIYTFKPTGLEGGTTYTVTVKAGLTDVTGSVLGSDYVWRFATASPRILEIEPFERRTNVLRDPVVSVVFSQPMDTEAIKQGFTLRSASGVVEGAFTWNDRNTRVTFKPASLLDYNTVYTINIDPDLTRSATGARLAEGATQTFRTIRLPDIEQTYPANGGVDVRESGITFRFTAPMDLKDFEKRVTIDPVPGLRYDNYSDEDGFYFNIGFSHEPTTAYTVTLDVTNFKDKYGTPLTLDPRNGAYYVENGKAVIRWRTPDYPPEASLRIGGTVGLYSAYQPTTRVFSTHRNIETIDLALASVDLDEFLRIIAQPYNPINRGQTTPLREWSVQVQNPRNVLRYDLLTITDQGPSTARAAQVNCADAPPSRLRRNDVVIVLPDDPTPLRVRQRAGTASPVIANAPANTEFTIIGGPLCVNSYVWWQVRSADRRIQGWVAEGSPQQYFIGPRGASAQVVRPTPPPTPSGQDVAPARALRPGMYLLDFSSPDLSSGREIQHAMLVATANVTLKLTAQTALAWVTDLQSGEPVASVNVQFYQFTVNRRGTQRTTSLTMLGEARTDPDGLAVFRFPARLENLYEQIYAVVSDGQHFSIGASSWDDGIEPYNFDQFTNYYPTNLTTYLYTDRSLYRPGQPVYFRGIVRARDDVTYSMPPSSVVHVEIRDREDQIIFRKKMQLSAFGSFSDSLTLDENAPLGYYTITARPGYEGEDPREENYRGPAFSFGFTVAQYRVPEFQVNVNAEKPEIVQGDTIRVNVESSFFFGGAVSNARVSWSAFSNNYYFSYRGAGYYSFFDYNEDEGFREFGGAFGGSVTEGQGVTDAQGRFTIELPGDLGKAKQSQRYTIEARVTDESDQMIAGRAEVIVHQGEFYIGAGPQEYIGTARKAQQINLLTVDWAGKPVPNTDLSVRVVERRWSSVQTVEPGTGRTVWNYEVKENPITDGEIRTDSEGKAVYEFTPDAGGIYKVYATSRDSRGNQITTSTFLWVAGPDYVPWRQQNSNRIDLKIDRDSYAVGDEASILIASPFQGETKALVTVERGNVLKTEVVAMPTNSYVYKLPITPDLAPNAYVSVTIVKGVDQTNPVAAFRTGLIQFSVDAERLNLNVEVTPDREQAGPRETVNYTIRVTDYRGEPVQAELGVGLTDLAVLSLLPDRSTPIMRHFYSEQNLSVRTAVSLVTSVDQRTQEILNTIKGGGGGGPESGIFEVRQLFIDTPLWRSDVVTDSNGEATVSVTLPDNLTTWRLDVRAATLPITELNTTLVGQTTFDLISTKPLLVRPITPRFYVQGDSSTLVAVVNNNTGADQDVTARIEIAGAALKSPAEQTARIISRGRQRFEWQIEVAEVDKLDVTFFASTADGRYTDAAKSAVGQGEDKTLPVLRYEAPETVGTAGFISAEGGTVAEGVLLPRRYDVQRGELSIRLDRSLAASSLEALRVLRRSDLSSIETVISRFLPNIATYGAFTRLGIANPQLKADLDNELQIAIMRLYAEQKVDGGWGWFYRDVSSPLVTAWALIGLSEARANGYAVEPGVIESAIRFLQRDLAERQIQPRSPTWALNRESFLLYALARADAGNFSRSVRLFEYRDLMSVYARAYLAMTFHILDPNNISYTDALISDLVNRAVLSATGAHFEESYDDYWNWNTDSRTTAIALKALVQIQPSNRLIPNIVRWLLIARKADAWETNQETAWAVMALVDYMNATGELRPNYTFGASLNGTALATNQPATVDNATDVLRLQVQVQDLLKGQLNRLEIQRTQGEGNLYYTAHLNAYLPVDLIKPASRGLTITRRYSLLTDRQRIPITQANVGDNILVTLTIVAPNDLHYVVITDPIPAGAEAVDPQLETSSVVGQRPELRRDTTFDNWGWWWFSSTEIRDEKVVLSATYLPKGTYRYTYTLRAGLAGKYYVMPATGQETYFPEVYGRTEGLLFTLNPAPAGANDPTNPAPTATPGN